LPDRIEIASSGRARCRACKQAIARGAERFAEAVPNPMSDGESQHYYHLTCAAERRPKPFNALLAQLEPARADLAPLAAAAALGVQHHRLERLGQIERAKSARAACRHCHEAIEKGAWRVALQPIEEGRLGTWGFIHLRCLADYAQVKPSPERLLRYSELAPEDAADVAAALSALPVPEPSASADPARARSEPASSDANSEASTLQQAGREPPSAHASASDVTRD
jgi:cytochrome c553